MNPLLSFDSVRHEYANGPDRIQVLDSVTFSVSQGELVGLVGRSGEGKSTIISLASGLLPVQHGSVKVDGIELAGASMDQRCQIRLRHIAMVFQEVGLLQGMTVLDNVALPLQINGLTRTDSGFAATKALNDLGLEGLESRFPGELSTGQRQRVGIARAICSSGDNQSKLLLVDEPTASLDSSSAADVLDGLRQAASLGLAVVVATHDPQVIEQMERSLALASGELRALEISV